MSKPMTALPDSLHARMQNETFVLLHTIDAETGVPTSSAISWVYAPTPEKLRLAIDQRSRLIANIKNNPSVTLTIFGGGTVYAVYGKAETVADPLEEVPFKLTCYDIHVEQIRDAMFYGARLTALPEYDKTYDKRAAAKLDNQVFAAMKKA